MTWGVLARFVGVELASVAAWYGQPVDWRTHTLEEKRREHANAYAKWTAEDEERLLDRYLAGVGLSELSAEFGRNVGGIRSRLVRLGAMVEPKGLVTGEEVPGGAVGQGGTA